MISSLTELFRTYSELDKPPILELQDINHKPVGALYLNKINCKKLLISETNNAERYYLYIDGIGIYFSYFRKFNLENI